MKKKWTGSVRRLLRSKPGPGCPTSKGSTPVNVVVRLAAVLVGITVALLTHNVRFATAGVNGAICLPAIIDLVMYRTRNRLSWEACGCENCISGRVRRWWDDAEAQTPVLLASLAQRHRTRRGRPDGRYLVAVHFHDETPDYRLARERTWDETLARMLAVEMGQPVLSCSAAEVDALERCCGEGLVEVAGPVDDLTAEMALKLVGTMPLERALTVAHATMA